LKETRLLNLTLLNEHQICFEAQRSITANNSTNQT